MPKRFIHIAIILFCAVTILPAQNPYLPGNLSGGTGVPGTKTRSPLNSMERAANNLPGATILTDTFGNQRFSRFVYISDTCLASAPPATGNTDNLNSFIKICGSDSTYYIDWTGGAVFTGGGSGAQNWYTVDDTTTDATRTAYILQNAQWVGVDPTGYIDMKMGDVVYGEMYLDATEASLYYLDLGGNEWVKINTNGISIKTSSSASRAVDITTDTINWGGSFDPTNLRINYVSDATYMYADSLKVVGLGQFPSFPSLVYDGTEKGFLYNPSSGGLTLINGNGTNGSHGYVNVGSSSVYNLATYVDAFYNYTDNGISVSSAQIDNNIAEQNSGSYYNQYASVDTGNVKWTTRVNDKVDFGDTVAIFQAYQTNDAGRNLQYSAMGLGDLGGMNKIVSSAYIGRAPLSSNDALINSNRIAFGVQQNAPGATGGTFDWLKIDLYDYDTTRNAIQFYNDRYRWKNGQPSPTSADTSFHYWAGNGAGGTTPGFMTLDDVCNHCAGSVVNWYNSNGTTTDNTRIATVTETATWFSTDGQADGVYPFRFELEDGAPNEPEMMVWKFPTDSLTLSQSDQEIIFHSTNSLLNRADSYYAEWADSMLLQRNGNLSWKLGADNRITQNTEASGAGTVQTVPATASITGVSQTELFLDGSSHLLVMPTNSISNFQIHVSAICSNAGNGVGLSTGESYAGWFVGGIKRIVNTTALVGSVQTTATAQADTGMSTSVVTIDADDTDDSLRIRFTPPSTAGTTSTFKVIATVTLTQTSY